MWLKDGETCIVTLWNNVPLQVTPPSHVELKIVETRVYRGPNYWNYEPAIKLIVDLGVLEHFPTNTLPGFTTALLEMLPGVEQQLPFLEHPLPLRQRPDRGPVALPVEADRRKQLHPRPHPGSNSTADGQHPLRWRLEHPQFPFKRTSADGASCRASGRWLKNCTNIVSRSPGPTP